MISTETMWIDGRYNVLCVGEESRTKFCLESTAECPEVYAEEENNHEEFKDKIQLLAASLKVCLDKNDLIQCAKLHSDIRNNGLLKGKTYIGNMLASMYAKCGALDKAEQVLDEMPTRNVVSWNVVIAGYARQGKGQEALRCYERMQSEGLCPNAITYTCTLKACGITQDLERGKQLHQEIVIEDLLGRDAVVGNALVDMYCKCGALNKAALLLAEMPFQDVVSWNTLIAGYAHHELGNEALKCYERMLKKGVYPNAITYTSILKACGITQNLERGKQIHDEIVSQEFFQKDVVLGNALVDMYAKCGAMLKAYRVLDDMPVRNIESWNAIIACYAKQGHGKEALDCYDRLRTEGLFPNLITYTCSLSACGITKNIDKGKQIHNEIVSKRLLGTDVALGNALIDMYAKCSTFCDALQVFDELPVRDAISWLALIAGYTQQGLSDKALDCFEQMRTEGVKPDTITYTAIVKACGVVQDAHKGRQIHHEITTQGLLKTDTTLGNALVDMYGKCHAMGKTKVLHELPLWNVSTWNGLIAQYAQHGRGKEALSCYERMLSEGFSPNEITYSCSLKACGIILDVDKGMKLHDEIVSQGLLQKDVLLGNALVDMYAKCGALSKAHEALENLPIRDVVSWNTLITGYSLQGLVRQALGCYAWMQTEGIAPDAITFAAILKSCCITRDEEKGAQIYGQILSKGLWEVDIVVGNALVDMYAKCGAVSKARIIVDEMPARDIVSWNALISGYIQQKHGKDVLNIFQQLQIEGAIPNVITYTYVLKACAITQDANRGRIVHGEIFGQGLLEFDSVLGNALVDMYGKIGAITEANLVLDSLPVRNVCSWSALIAGYVQHGHGNGALECYERMLSESIFPNAITYTCILKACAIVNNADKGNEIHDEIAMRGLLEGNIILGNALIDMYVKGGKVSKAAQLLNEMPMRDCFSWSTVISGYILREEGEECLDCYERMQSEGLSPNAITFTQILKACSITRDIYRGQKIHDEIISKGFVLGNALASMYGECGSIASAQQVLELLPDWEAVASAALAADSVGQHQPEHCMNCFGRTPNLSNMATWNALIGGFVQQGLADEALDCFQLMQSEGVCPDAAMFTLALKACCQLGLVSEGQEYFNKMKESCGITPVKEHYTCMVHLFGHAGHLDKALAVIKQMPTSDHLPVWSALLGASQKSGNVKFGRFAFESALKLDEGDAVSCLQS